MKTLYIITLYGSNAYYKSRPLSPTEYLNTRLLIDKAGAIYSTEEFKQY